MSNVVIVTDSTAYIPSAMIEEYSIRVAPQILIWGAETYLDGVDIMPDEFYKRLQKATVMPSSSQVTPVYFEKIFRDLLAQGSEVLAILISSKLSGTIDSANQAVAAIGECPVEIVDSLSTSMGLGFHVLSAARAAEKGASLAECKEVALRARDRTGIVLTVDTLEFLHRGGRIGGGTRFLGTALSIKPVLELTDGKLEGVEKVRTRAKALQRLVDIISERIGSAKPIHLAVLHANSPTDAQWLLDKAKNSLNVVESVFSEVSPVIGTHAGPGTVGLAWMVAD